MPLLSEQKVNRLAVLIHGTLQIAPFPLNPNVGLIHPPAAPDGPLAAVERFFKRWAIFQGPAVDGRVIDGHPALLYQLFHLAVAQGIGHVPPHAGQDDVLHRMGPLEADHCRAPSLGSSPTGRQGPIIPEITGQGKFATEPISSLWRSRSRSR